MIYEAIKKLVQYGLDTGLITEVDKIYATNQILDVMRMDEYEEPEGESLNLALEVDHFTLSTPAVSLPLFDVTRFTAKALA